MIDSVGYIIVTIELPSPRAFASILYIYRRAPGSDALVSRGPPNSPAPSLEGNGWFVRAGSSPADERDLRHLPPMTFWRGTGV
jgi:hypothetical protein